MSHDPMRDMVDHQARTIADPVFSASITSGRIAGFRLAAGSRQ